MVMLYTGLRISDAVCLEREKLNGKRLLLRALKNQAPVYTILPQQALDALAAVTNANPEYFFWTGNGARQTAIKNWHDRLSSLFKAAGVKNARPHRFRDTFSVRL